MSTKKKGNPAEGFGLTLPTPPPRTPVDETKAAEFVGDATPRPAASPRQGAAVPLEAPPAPTAARDEPTPPPAPTSRKAQGEAGAQGARVERVRKTDGEAMRRTTVWLKTGLAKRLAIFCAARDLSQTEVIEAALAAHLERHGG